MKLFLLLMSLFFASPAYASYLETYRAQYRTDAEALAAAKTYSGYHHHEGPLPAGSYPDGLFSNYTFYISYASVGSDWNYGVYEIPCPNAASYESQCGGPQYYTFDLSSCTGACISCYQQKKSKVAECGGFDKVQCDNNCTCGCKIDCSTQAAALASQCGMSVSGVPIDKAIQCDPQCNCSCTECGSILQSKIEECGGVDGVLYVDGGSAGCTAKCKNVCLEEARQACHDKPPAMVMGGGTIDSPRNIKWYEDIDGRCLYECNCQNYNYTQNDTNTYDFQTCQQASFDKCKQPDPSVVCGEYLKTFRTYDYNTCFYTCDTCASRNDECREKCGAQGGKVYGCSEQTHYEGMCVCGDKDCSQGSDACAEQCIGKGGVLAYECGGACRCRKDADNCEQAKSSFADSCADRGGVKYNECTESDGHITSVNMRCNHDPEPGLSGVDPNDYIPDDILKTCDDLRPNCSPACNFVCTSGPGGVVVGKPRCDCSTPSANPETPADTPSSDPANGDDSNGWLKGIKDNTDTLVEQGNDLKEWFSSSKQNSDKQLALTEQGNTKLDNISKNQALAVDNLNAINKNIGIYSDNEVKSVDAVRQAISGFSGTNDRLGGVNDRLNVANTKLNDLVDGLNDTSIGTSDSSSLNGLGGGGEITGSGYGFAPTSADLPGSGDIKSAFGTYTPSSSGYGGIVESSLSKIEPVVSEATCSSTLHLPVPTLSGLEWKDYPFDLCPYAQYISMIGDALVFLTALYELFKLAA